MSTKSKTEFKSLPPEIQAAFRTWIGGNLQPLLDAYRNNSTLFHSLDLPRRMEHPVLWRRIVLSQQALTKLVSGSLPTLKSLESWSYDEQKVRRAGCPWFSEGSFDVIFKKEMPLNHRLVCCDSVGIGLAYEAEIICYGHPVSPEEIVHIADNGGRAIPKDFFAAKEYYGADTKVSGLVRSLMMGGRNR